MPPQNAVHGKPVSRYPASTSEESGGYLCGVSFILSRIDASVQCADILSSAIFFSIDLIPRLAADAADIDSGNALSGIWQLDGSISNTEFDL